MTSDPQFIRNFCIIAHIDHGKSTLADRFIQKARLIAERDFQAQVLDSLAIERQRGITIKSQAVCLPFVASDGIEYTLNFVDTPGHVDFSYEVSRAVASCEGAILLVDASQGVEAQTVSNFYLAFENNLEIVLALNKIDLPAADIPRVRQQIDHELGLDGQSAIPVSAKMNQGIEELLEAVCRLVPPPQGENINPLQALIFDSHYDPYRGVVMHVRIFQGLLKAGQEIIFMNTGERALVEEVGVFRVQLEPMPVLGAGMVGYCFAGIKRISDVKVGDTLTEKNKPCAEALPGFKEVKPVVFSAIYPMDTSEYDELHKALEKLQLNDASLSFEKTSSAALGFGFKCGFLGLLHMEVTQERLEAEYNLSVIVSSPSVRYQLKNLKGEHYQIETPGEFPGSHALLEVQEPYIRAHIILPSQYLGSIMGLCLEKRGIQENMVYLDEKRVELTYAMPLAEVISDFYDKLKSLSRGYASFDYDIIDYRSTDLVKLDILVNGELVDALSMLVFRANARSRAVELCKRLLKEIPRQQFKIPLQGAVGSQIVARETIAALRKDVTAKCYGGDITRKKKLLEKQKEGKKRMKMVGSVEIPQKAFLAALRSSEE